MHGKYSLRVLRVVQIATLNELPFRLLFLHLRRLGQHYDALVQRLRTWTAALHPLSVMCETTFSFSCNLSRFDVPVIIVFP